MIDKSTYKHIETIYFDKIDYIIVETKVRGVNKFGVNVYIIVKASFDIDGNMIGIPEEK